MEKKYMEWYRFKSSKLQSGIIGFFIAFFLIIIIDRFLINFDLFDSESNRDLLYIELIDLGIIMVSMIFAYLYTYIWFALSNDTLYYVRYGRLKGSYNIYNCKFDRDYKTRRMFFAPDYFKPVPSRIRIAVETEQGERHILKGTGFSINTFDNIFERMKELKQYDNNNPNGEFILPQQIFRKQLIHKSWIHLFDSWKTPWKIDFGGSFVTIGKQTFFKSKIESLNMVIDGAVRKLVVQQKDSKKVFYLGSTDDTILDMERMRYEIQKLMN